MFADTQKGKNPEYRSLPFCFTSINIDRPKIIRHPYNPRSIILHSYSTIAEFRYNIRSRCIKITHFLEYVRYIG